MTFGHVDGGGFLVCLEVGVDEFNETIEIFRGNLEILD